MNRLRLTVAAILSAVTAVPLQVAAWNAPTHIVTGSIAYRILETENQRTVSVLKTLLEKHPWYADRWRDDVEKLPESQRGEMLFMLAARWADDIRTVTAPKAIQRGITSTFPSNRQASQKTSKPRWRRTGESSKARYRRINGQSRWRGYYT